MNQKPTQDHLKVPLHAETRLQRALEILPGALTWLFLLLPAILGFFAPVWAAYLVMIFAVFWLFRIMGFSYRLIKGYGNLQGMNGLDWRLMLKDLDDLKGSIERVERRLKSARLSWQRRSAFKKYLGMLKQAQENKEDILNVDDIHHVAIVATYNESLTVLEPTVAAVANTRYNTKKMILVIAYEERGGKQTEKNAQYLVEKYGSNFKDAWAVKHPADIPGEVIGKAGNITFAARKVTDYVKKNGFNPEHFVVTTLDSDNRPSPNYFAYLSYMYAITPERIQRSYQPIPLFFNNIWDVPAPMRVIASSNSFWVLMEAHRPHRMRNFSAHAQSLQTLIDTDYWNVESIVEDGHQYWRTYFTYGGNHKVLPIYAPIYQDAVLAKGYIRTFKMQFYQLRRWAWGVVDTPYLIINSFRDKRIPWKEKAYRIGQQIEGYFSWATAPLVLAYGAWMPLLVNPDFTDQVLAHQLPIIASRVQTIALIGLLAPIIASLATLPPKPKHYGKSRAVMMVLQWALIPVTLIGFGSFAAINAQTRLMFGKYLTKFNVTEKATKK